MSGVNCTRACASDSACASARTSSVLPRPGTPSMSTWPDATSATSTCSMTAACPTIAWPIAARRPSSARRPRRQSSSDSAVPCDDPRLLGEDAAPRRFEQRDRAAQLVRRGACADGEWPRPARRRRSRSARASASARSCAGQRGVAGDPRARAASSSARTAAACSASPPPWRSANWPVPRICSASERRAASRRRRERAEPHAAAPQQQRDAAPAPAPRPARRSCQISASSDGWSSSDRKCTSSPRRSCVAATNSQP